jgi:hypothetical protein
MLLFFMLLLLLLLLLVLLLHSLNSKLPSGALQTRGSGKSVSKICLNSMATFLT